MYDPERAAKRILDSRATALAFEPASAWYGPGFDMAAAYAVQDAYVEMLKLRRGAAVAGYKVGLTNLRMQAMCGVDEPVAGVVLASGLQHSPGKVRAADYMHLGIECEIAVRLAADVKPETLPSSPETAGRLIDRVAAAFELVDDAKADYTRLDGVSLVADNSWNAGLVLGPEATYDGRPLTGRRGVLSVNGEERDRGMSDDVLGDPLSVVVWLANHLTARGRHLSRGDWITTGSIVTTKFAQPGEVYEFRVDDLEPVRLSVG
jgi:2-keto-4-pentenoate hydratase